MTDNFCLLFDPKSQSCIQNFSFFSFGDWDKDIFLVAYSYLGLAPINKLNGPSFVSALNETGSMLNSTVSWQLGDWGSENNNITFGGNIEGAFLGHLKFNLILATSPWVFNLNY